MADSILFSNFRIRGVDIRNRLWVSPMCQYSCLDHDGMPNDWHLMHLGRFAAGGVGLVMAEATGVLPEGRISAECAGLWNDAQRDSWARIVRLVQAQGARMGIQLAHAGRKASTYKLFSDKEDQTRPVEDGGWQTVAPSAVAFPGLAEPVALDLDGIDRVVDAFAAAAQRAMDARFDLVEIHAAHGYLIHEFLSPISNQRTDEYGGSLENRARLLLRIVDAVRAVVGDQVPVFVRFSGTDWVEGAWDEEETAQVARWAHERGADLFDISSGGITADVPIPVSPGYQVWLSEHVRRATDAATSTVGLITDPHFAEQILADGKADAIMVGRELLRDPNLAFRAADALGEQLEYWPIQMRAGRRRFRVED